MRQKRSEKEEQYVRLHYAKQPKPSIPCPECGTSMNIDLFSPVSGSCGKCGIHLKLKEEESRDAIAAFNKLDKMLNMT